MITKKLRDHASAQCCVRHYENGDLCLQSYLTDIIYYDHKQQVLYCTGTYSQTTRKHISWFLREYFPSISYQTMRDAYENTCKLSECLRGGAVKLTQKERDTMYSAHYGKSLSPDCFKTII